MGAVQKLATVVIVGLVALATLLVVYLAAEPQRRGAEAEEQEHVAIERGIETYLANCLVCHGPGGEGYSREDGRVGAPLGGDTELGRQMQELNQIEDPIEREERYDLIVETLHQGRGLMPAFGRGAEGGALLNDEQIHELATMIQNVDWDVVYNEAIALSGGAYPTAPAPPDSEQQAAQAQQQGEMPSGQQAATQGGGDQAAAQGGGGAPGPVTVEGVDIAWVYNGQRSAPGQPVTVTVAPGTTISLPNSGATLHNFSVDALGIDVDMPVGETVEAVIPADAAPGEYEFYCNVPGHPQAGMVGTLVIDPNAGGGAAAAPEAAPAASPEAAPTDQQAAAPAAPAAPITLEGVDIAWVYNGQRSAPGQPFPVTVQRGATISLPNTGATLHNFAVDALGIDVDMPAGETVEATIPADAAPGEYEFYCNVPGHKQAGMVGTLIVQ